MNTTRTRTTDDVRALVYAVANDVIDTEDGAIYGPRGAQRFIHLAAHCHAVAEYMRPCETHDAHIDALARWSGMSLQDVRVWRVARWCLAINGGSFLPLSMGADDVLQAAVLEILEHGEPLTLGHALNRAGRTLADIIDAADAADEVTRSTT